MTTRKQSLVSRSGNSIPGLDAFYQEFFEDPLFDEFYNGSGYANFGYWDSRTKTAAQASDRLVRKIMSYVPRKHRFKGRILDVACGQGASTRWLLDHYPGKRITAIGLDSDQLQVARKRAKGADIRKMDAARLDFPDESFDTVLCVEAAFHFQTRARFLSEAYRVLKPGGYLVMSDLLMARTALLVPRENYVRDPAEYERLLARTGFTDIRVADATRQTWQSYRNRLNQFVSARVVANLQLSDLSQLLILNAASSWSVRACLLVGARKPKRD